MTTTTTKRPSRMKVVYVNQEFPKSWKRAIMLVGPTPRKLGVLSWRPEALQILDNLEYDGVVFIPETEDGLWQHNYDHQIETEELMLHFADCIVTWIPREMFTMPALTTNDEWGTWKYSGKTVFGAPPDAPSTRYQQYYANKLYIPSSTTLRDTLISALDRIGDGALRQDGERYVPLYVWRAPSFQEWYKNLLQAGNRLDSARVEFTFRVGKTKSIVFMWVLHANIYVTSENRNKTNEIVVARPDISTVLAYRRGSTFLETEIALIKEFRSTVSNAEGFVYELAGGSSFKPGGNPKQLAAEECGEEMGLVIDPSRLNGHGSRQLMATFSTHHAHPFSVELTEQEVLFLKKNTGIPHGDLEESERTYVEVWTLREILDPKSCIDWSTIGMILSILRE